jgi:hypothetical protein
MSAVWRVDAAPDVAPQSATAVFHPMNPPMWQKFEGRIAFI